MVNQSCAVFSQNYDKASAKLLDIFREKGCPVVKQITRGDWQLEYHYADEMWALINPSSCGRGKRFYKAWVDVDCTIQQLQSVILPMCINAREIKYF